MMHVWNLCASGSLNTGKTIPLNRVGRYKLDIQFSNSLQKEVSLYLFFISEGFITYSSKSSLDLECDFEARF